jgi:hypothetical protein
MLNQFKDRDKLDEDNDSFANFFDETKQFRSQLQEKGYFLEDIVTNDHGFWINDLYFEVPPERISVQEENNYAEFQGLRSSGSYKIPVGIASQIFTISLSIPSKTSINNIDTRDDGTYGNTGKRGGILDLIIQFKNIPFSVINNAYIRSKLKTPMTHNMVFCLHNLAISTSPGEPGTLVAAITVSPMGYTPYSNRWLYKTNWVSKTGVSFEEVNTKKHSNYDKVLAQNSWISYNSPNDKESGSSIVTTATSVVNPKYQLVESINSIDQDFLKSTDVTLYAHESSIFKEYVDWLHLQWTNKVVNNLTPGVTQIKTANNDESRYHETYDFTKISPYASREHDTGKKLILKWKEFKTIPIDPEVADEIRAYFKRKIVLERAKLFNLRLNPDGTIRTATDGSIFKGDKSQKEEENNLLSTIESVFTRVIVDPPVSAASPQATSTAMVPGQARPLN